MAFSSADLITFFTNANIGKAPTAAQQLLLQTYASQTQTGALTDDAALQRVIDLLDGTTAVASQTYQFFTGATPGTGGYAFLVNSATNANDLNDVPSQYSVLNTENRFINFSINLGATAAGEGRAQFAATYGTLTFEQVVAVAYETIIGTAAAQAAGINVAASLAFLGRAENQAYLRAYVAEKTPAGTDVELAIRAGVVGQIMAAGTVADVGNYNAASERLIADLFDGKFSSAITETKGVDLLAAYPNAPTSGKTFTLTAAADTAPAFLGTASDDTFIATNLTLGASDILQGGSGTDTLLYASSGAGAAVQSGFQLSSIERVAVTSDAALGSTFDVSGAVGTTQLAVENSSTATTLTGINNLVDIAVRNTSTAQPGQTTNVTVNYNAAATAGAADVQSITLDNVFDPAVGPGSAAKNSQTALVLNGAVETIAITTAGGAGSNLTNLDANNLSAVTAAGGQDLTLQAVGFDAAANKLDASALGGKLTVTLNTSGVNDVAVTGGANDDRANFSAGFDLGDAFDGGAGVDTLALSNAVATAVTLGGSLTNVEGLAVTDGATGVIDMDNFGSVRTVTLEGGQVGNVVVDDAVTGTTLNFGAETNAGLTVELDLKTDGGADVLTVNVSAIGAADSLATLKVDDAETLNLSFADDPTVNGVGTFTLGLLDAGDTATLKLSGNANVTINAAQTAPVPNAASVGLTTLDATGLSGVATLTGLDFPGLNGVGAAVGGATISGGSGGINITTGTGQGKDVVNLGAGADVIKYTAIGQSDDDADTINGFDVTKDAVDLTLFGLNSSTQFVGSRANFALSQGALVGGGNVSAVFQEDLDILWVDNNGDGNLDNRDFRVILNGVDGTQLKFSNIGIIAGATFTAKDALASFNTNDPTNSNEGTKATGNNDTFVGTVAQVNNAATVIDGLGGNLDTLTITGTGVVNLNQAGTQIDNVEVIGAAGVTILTLDDADLAAGGGEIATVSGGAGVQTLTVDAGANLTKTAVSSFETLLFGAAGTVTIDGADAASFTTAITGSAGADVLALGINTLFPLGTTSTYDFSNTLLTKVETLSADSASDIKATIRVDAADLVDVTTITGDVSAGVEQTLQLNDSADVSGKAVTNIDNLSILGADQTATVAAAQVNATNFTKVLGSGTSNLKTTTDADVDFTAATITGVDSIDVTASATNRTISFDVDSLNSTVTKLTGAADANLKIDGAVVASNLLDITGFDSVTFTSGSSLSLGADLGTIATVTGVAGGAAERLVINLPVASSFASAFTAVTDASVVINDSTGADTINTGDVDDVRQDTVVNLTAGGVDTVTIDNAAVAAGSNAVNINGFVAGVGGDRLDLEIANTNQTTLQFYGTAGANVTAGTNGVIVINSSVVQVTDFTATADGGGIETALINTFNAIADGSYNVVLYGTGGAGVYQVTITDAGADGLLTAAGEIEVELVGLLNGVTSNSLTIDNFIAI